MLVTEDLIRYELLDLGHYAEEQPLLLPPQRLKPPQLKPLLLLRKLLLPQPKKQPPLLRTQLKLLKKQ